MRKRKKNEKSSCAERANLRKFRDRNFIMVCRNGQNRVFSQFCVPKKFLTVQGGGGGRGAVPNKHSNNVDYSCMLLKCST